MRRWSRLAMLAALPFGLLASCRAVLGIENAPALSETDAGEKAVEDAPAVETESAPLVSIFCRDLKPPPGFCDDFDIDPFEGKWDNAYQRPDPGLGGGGTLQPDTTRYLSAPRSALMTVPQLLPGTEAVSLLITTVPKGLRLIEISAAIRIDTELFSDDRGHVGVLGLSFVGAEGKYVEIRRAKSGASLALYGGIDVPLLQPFPVGEWKTVEMRFELGGASSRSRVITYIDGVGSGEADLPADFDRPTDYPRVVVGPGVATGPIGAHRMNVDNFFVRGTLK